MGSSAEDAGSGLHRSGRRSLRRDSNRVQSDDESAEDVMDSVEVTNCADWDGRLFTPLLDVQRLDRIDASGTARRNEHRQGGREADAAADEQERRWIARRDADEQL